MTKQFTMTITAESLAVLTLFTAKEDIRQYLNGIYCECGPKGGRMVATDGHRLMVANVDRESCEGEGAAILAPSTITALQSMLKQAPRAIVGVPVTFTTTSIEPGEPWDIGATLCGQSISAKSLGAKYPPYQRVFPTKLSGEPAQFDPAYIASFGKAAKARGDRRGIITIGHNGQSGALVDIGDASRYLGVLMPVRVRDDPVSVPEWITQGVMADDAEAQKAA